VYEIQSLFTAAAGSYITMHYGHGHLKKQWKCWEMFTQCVC